MFQFQILNVRIWTQCLRRLEAPIPKVGSYYGELQR
jgi:hypothetical protein